jgi:hypothetical protein
MKQILLFLVAAAMTLPAQAQLFGPESVAGGVLGGVAGGIIGHNSGRRTAEGAAIGAGAGLVLGALAGHERRERQAYYPHHAPAYSHAHGYAPYGYSRPNHMWTGAALGGIAGGVIGHNSGRRTAEGIAIGAGGGLLLGALSENRARWHPPRHYYAPRYHVPSRPVYYSTPIYHAPPSYIVPPATHVAPAPAVANPPAPQVTIINNHYYNSSGSSMGGANTMFGR